MHQAIVEEPAVWSQTEKIALIGIEADRRQRRLSCKA